MYKVVVISGASSGIGRAAAREFARKGWRVALLARASERLDDALAEIGQQVPTLALPTDVADADQVEAAAAEVERRWGRIDAWVNNAMVTIYAPADRIRPDELRRVTDVSYHGAVWGTQAALKRMRARGGGTIIQVGSALAYRSIPLQAAYCGAKAALRGYTDALRSELIHARSKVHLTTVHLAAFNTPQFEWGRTRLPCQPRPVGTIYQPEIAAEAIFAAACERRREWWVGLPVFQSVLGQRVLPHYLDRRMARDAWGGQMGEVPVAADRPDNLWESAPGRQAAHGRFDQQAQNSSPAWWLSKHRRPLAAVALALLGTAAAGALRRRR